MADQMACGFLLELLLADYLKRMPLGLRPGLVELIRTVGKRTFQLSDQPLNDEAAELLADVAVRMQGALDQYLSRALSRTVDGLEGTS